MELLLTFVGILKYLVIGSSIVLLFRKYSLIKRELPQSSFLVFSFLFGIAATTLILHIALLTNALPIGHMVVWIALIISLLYLFQERKYFEKFIPKKDNWISKAIFIAGFFVQSLILSLQPVMSNDARGIWLLKAKALYEGGVTAFIEYLNNPHYSYSHTDYPITMPLLYTDLLKPLGHFWEPTIGIFSFTFFFFLLIALYGALRHYTRVSIPVAFLIIAVIFFTPEYARQGWSGLSDVPLSLVILGTGLAFLFRNTTSPIYSFLPVTVFAGLAATIKNEGQPFLVLTLLAITIVTFTKIVKEKRFLSTFYFALPLIPLVIWKYFTNTYAIENDLLSAPNFKDIISRIPVLFSEITPRLFDGYRFGILFIPALFAIFIPSTIRRRKESKIFGFVVLGQGMLYIMIYLITPHDLKWHIATSFSRLLLQLLPSIFFLAILSRSPKNTV
ncbi:hypothetical protein IT418_00710 [bacterium]|nr:hypothetical protein [bacterium]